MIPDKNVDEARVRAGALVGLIDLLGKDATAEDIQRASLVPLTDQAAQAAFNLCCGILMQRGRRTQAGFAAGHHPRIGSPHEGMADPQLYARDWDCPRGGGDDKGAGACGPYLPQSISGQSERIDGEVVRKQREGNRLLVKVATAQGPMLVTFTQKVAELDLLLEPGDRVDLITPGYATFVEDPTLERVRKPAGAVAAPSPPSTASGSPQGSQEKTGR